MGALDGIRVLDIATVIAAPYAASILGDFGADVIKVEMPEIGDPFRKMGPLTDGKSIRWASIGRNKKSVTLNIHSPKGKEVFLKLVEKSDVIVENFRTGTMEKWGLDIETLRRANPKIIVAHVTGFGQSGPYKNLTAFGLPCTAFSGVTYCLGYSDRPPITPSFSLADYVAGMNTVIGILIALYQRDALHGVQSQEIDSTLYEPLFRMQDTIVADYHINGVIKERTPCTVGSASPSGIFQTKDGKFVALSCGTSKVFGYLTKAMERPDLWEDYQDASIRLANDTTVKQITIDWILTQTFAQLKEKCDREGVPVCLVYSVEDIFNDPHYAARHNIVEVPYSEFETMKMPSVTPVLSETPGEVRWAGQTLGESNNEVFKILLGMDTEAIEELKAAGII